MDNHLFIAINFIFFYCDIIFLFRAKVQVENKKGHTALDIAKAYADPRVLQVVQKRWDEIPPPVDKKKKKGKKKGLFD